ncbi:MAG: aldehyde dehydrogenase family protein [Gammaproteobacteria bacterium]
MVKYQNYINNDWVACNDTGDNINPSDVQDIVGTYCRADASHVNDAVGNAVKGFAVWQDSTPQSRFDALDYIGTQILEKRQELGQLLSREEGKTLAEGIGEATRAGHIFKYFAGEALRTSGEVLPSVRNNISVEVTREPVGVIGVITPWNFPLAIPAWKIAPALAFGNCVVFKPAELVPACAHALAEIIAGAKLPPGVFNLLIGPGSVVGNAIIEHPDVAAISFTGSHEVGVAAAGKAIKRLAKIQLEMGGKNPLVVLDDADITTAVECATQGAFFSTGQRCTASSRLIVTAGIHDQFVETMINRLSQLKTGNALHKETDVGPLASEQQLSTVQQYIELGQSEGAEIAFGGNRLQRETEGYYLENTLFINSNNDMKICQEEIFGPVATIIRVQDLDEALETANDTEFGLSSGVCTQSLKSANHFKRYSAAGMVMVNAPTAGVDYHVPFGGRKNSSYGPKEQGGYAKEFYTQSKTIYVA